MADTPEGKVKKAIDKLLDELDVFFWKPPQNGYGRAGVSDRIAIIKGRILAVEAKAEGEQPTWPQQQFLNDIEEAGGQGIVIWPHNLEDLRLRVLLMKGLKP